jgi:hypothetical protein
MSDALEPLEEMHRGLKDDLLKFFLARPETTAFRDDAQDLFLATKREGDAERLRKLIQP